MPQCNHSKYKPEMGDKCPECQADLRTPVAPPPITAERLRDEEGFPLVHTQAFVAEARAQEAVILTRTPGAACEGPLREGYTAKGFHIKAKSCDFGVTAGFLCLDPIMNKKSRAGALGNLVANHKSLSKAYESGKKSGVIALEISDERLKWLRGPGQKITRIDDLTAERVLAVCSEKSVEIRYLLIRRGERWAVHYDVGALYGLPQNTRPTAQHREAALKHFLDNTPLEDNAKIDRHTPEYFAEFWELLLANAGAAPTAPGYEHFVPVQAMTNPHLEYAASGPEAYKNAVTGDYDLFAVWPKKFDAELDTRVAGMSAGLSDKLLVDREEANAVGKVMGNITERLQIIGVGLNGAMTPGAVVKPNRVFHSDEAGRPDVHEVDSAAAFTPTGEMYMIKRAAELAGLIQLWGGKGWSVSINKGWAPWLASEVHKFVRWSESIADAPSPAPAPGKPAGSAAATSATTSASTSAPPPLDEQQRALHARTARLQLGQQEMNLRQQEQQLQIQRSYLDAHEDDERMRILNAVRVMLPDISQKIGPDMQESALKAKEFTADDKTTLLALKGATLQANASDFFKLSKLDRDDLLDRVGLYRGIIIDHAQTEIVQQGFRELLKRRPSQTGAADDPALATQPAKILYRKPKHAGFFDSTYTFSEALHQVQTNGVTNLSFSLAVAGGAGVKWGVGVGYGYSKQSQENHAETTRTIYITTSYFLPKVELSFDYLQPCASDEFVAAVKHAVELADGERRYPQLLRVLAAFGQFVPTRLLVGGKLYATSKKTLTASEDASDVTTRHTAQAKVFVKASVATVSAEASFEKSDREQKKDEKTDESQAMSFTAVGGEGALLREAGAWANSLADYSRWSPVQFDSPIPSLSLLPEPLARQAIAVLRARASQSTIRQVLADGAHFLFYGEYAEWVGKHARRVEFTVRSREDGRVFNLDADEPGDGVPVHLFAAQGWDKQVWYMTPEGHILSRVTRQGAEFALSIVAAGGLVVTQKGRAPHQLWEFTASGHLVNLSCEPAKVLTSRNGQLTLDTRAATPVVSQLWEFVELGANAALPILASQPAAVSAAAPAGEAASTPAAVAAPADPLPRGSARWFALIARNGQVLTVRDADSAPISGGMHAVLQPDLGGDHQRWRWTEAGALVCKRRSGDDELALTRGDKPDVPLQVQPVRGDLRTMQQWDIRREGYLVSTHDNTCATATPGLAQGSGLVLRDAGADDSQSWRREAEAEGASGPSFTDVKQTDGRWGGGRLTRIDTAPLVVAGRIRGAEFILLWETSGTFERTERCFSVKLLVENDAGVVSWVENSNRNADTGDRLHVGSDLYVDTNPLYLPQSRIDRFQVVKKLHNRVAPAIQIGEHSPVVNQNSHDSDHFYFGDDDLYAMGGPVLAPDDKEVVGLSFFKGGERTIGLRLLLKPRG